MMVIHRLRSLPSFFRMSQPASRVEKPAARRNPAGPGNFYEYHAVAIGGRSQSAKTYLEKQFETFPDASLVTESRGVWCFKDVFRML